MRFSEYLSITPTLYDGVDLDKGTIDYLNNWFYDYSVYAADGKFERQYLNNLRRSVGIYNNLKSIELCDRIFDITTNQSIKDATVKTIDRLKSDRTLNKTGSNTTNDTGTTTTGNTQKYTPVTDVRTAVRNVPMNSKGTFDEMFDWDELGATQVTEQKNNGGTDVTTNDQTVTDNTQSKTVLDTQDVEKLKQLNDIANKSKEYNSAVNGQVVGLVSNIWDYLVTPKAIDYLVDQVEPSFILVY